MIAAHNTKQILLACVSACLGVLGFALAFVFFRYASPFVGATFTKDWPPRYSHRLREVEYLIRMGMLQYSPSSGKIKGRGEAASQALEGEACPSRVLRPARFT